MRHRGYYSEEDDIYGKIYDADLVKRLLKYAKPYAKYVIISISLLLIITVLDLSQPYLTKIAIDRHITISYKEVDFEGMTALRETITERNPDLLIPLQDEVYLIDVSKLKDIDPENLQKLKDKKRVSQIRYLLIHKENYKPEKWEDVRSICEKYDQFIAWENGYYASYNGLDAVERNDLNVIRSNDLHGLLIIVIIYSSILIINFFFNYGQVYLMTYTAQKIMYDLRMDIVEHLQKMSLTFFDDNPVGKLVTRPTNDVKALEMMYTNVLNYVFKDVFTLLGIVLIMVRMHWKLALVSFTIIPFVVIATKIFRDKARRAYRKVRKAIAKINATLNENISGIRIVKIFNQEKEVYEKFQEINHEKYDASFRQMKVMATFGPSLELLMSIAVGLVLWYGGLQVISDTLTLGVLVAFISYVRMIKRPIRQLSEKYNIMQSAMAASERIFGLLDTEPQIENHKEHVKLNSVKGHIKFEDVSFAYKEDEWVLKNINFDVKPGESVALVGATGAGKTSIINLLSRFYDIQKGKITIDGKDIKLVDKYELRSKIGVVLQDPFLFSRDIRANIKLNSHWISDEEVIQSAQYVNADYFIEKLPEKYDEPVMERGVTLSTGQKQLLAFARVLAHDPQILVLDEATSNIDTETERLIQEAMYKLMKNRTSIIIAHRLSTIKHVDKIIVLHKGKIRETGTHQELLGRKGIYYNLYQLQYQAQEK